MWYDRIGHMFVRTCVISDATVRTFCTHSTVLVCFRFIVQKPNWEIASSIEVILAEHMQLGLQENLPR